MACAVRQGRFVGHHEADPGQASGAGARVATWLTFLAMAFPGVTDQRQGISA